MIKFLTLFTLLAVSTTFSASAASASSGPDSPAREANAEFPVISTAEDPVYYIFGNPKPLIGKEEYDFEAKDNVIRHLLNRQKDVEKKNATVLDRHCDFDETSQWRFELAGDSRDDGYHIVNFDGTYLGTTEEKYQAFRYGVKEKALAKTWYLVPVADIIINGEGINPNFDGYAISLTPDGHRSINSSWAFNTVPDQNEKAEFDKGGCIWIIEEVEKYKLKELAYKLANASEWTADFYRDILQAVDDGLVTEDNIHAEIAELNEAIESSINDELFGKILKIESARRKYGKDATNNVWSTHLERTTDGDIKVSYMGNLDDEHLVRYYWQAEKAEGGFYLKNFNTDTYLTLPDSDPASKADDDAKGTVFKAKLALEPHPGVYLFNGDRYLGVDPDSNGSGTIRTMTEGTDGTQWYIGLAPNTIRNISLKVNDKVEKKAMTIIAGAEETTLTITPSYKVESIPEAFQGISSLKVNGVEAYHPDGKAEAEITVPKRFTFESQKSFTVKVMAIGGATATLVINVVNPPLTALTATRIDSEKLEEKGNTAFKAMVKASDPADFPIDNSKVTATYRIAGDEAATPTDVAISHIADDQYEVRLPKSIEDGSYLITIAYATDDKGATIEADPIEVEVAPYPWGTVIVGIDQINSDSVAGAVSIHDLQGRQLKVISAPGIYIVNGVKTLVK
ncbi:MAG: hypothetical protein NC342_05620 [Pseudoflavonifractor sp.]|nr:hypothetical protein [Alloprevotella sp.]MCM1116995.1 hypothetical protein [Pseudoflavonifractor sp.]